MGMGVDLGTTFLPATTIEGGSVLVLLNFRLEYLVKDVPNREYDIKTKSLS